MKWRGIILVASLAPWLPLDARGDTYFTFQQQSNPQGIIVSQSGQYPEGIPLQTDPAPLEYGAYSFGYWTLNGQRAADPLGQAPTQAAFSLHSNTTAVAWYLPTVNDSDVDGLEDHLEWRWFGDLGQSKTNNPDGDAFSIEGELERDYSPLIADALADGGIMARVSGQMTFRNEALFKHYLISSTPQGIVALQKGHIDIGHPIASPTITYGESSGYHFGYWEVNGGRKTDASGASLPCVILPMTNDTEAIARFFPAGDNDGDGMADWYEWHWFGNLNLTSTNDPDADGFAIADELTRGYNPVANDHLADGGIMARVSANKTYRDEAAFKNYKVRSNPQGLIESRNEYVNKGAIVTTPTIEYGETSGYHFGYWEVNGERQADTAGVALPNVVLTMTNDTVAIAHFFPAGDEDTDGMEDWYEWHWFGDLNQSTTNNPDDDDFSIAKELDRGYSPTTIDRLIDGGVMRRLSRRVTFRDEALMKGYTILSDPQGIIEPWGAYVETGTPVATPTIECGETSGYFFGYWAVNGTRRSDSSGTALPSVILPMTNDTIAIAHFFPPGDEDSDGMEDWYEWNWFGDMDQSSTNDPDADGLNIASEQMRGYSPVTPDLLFDGGIMMRVSRKQSIQFGYFPVITEGMLDGNRATLFSPNASAPATFNFSSNSHPALGDWDGDGDLDLFVGYQGGGMQIFENAGSPQTANWVKQTTNFLSIAHVWNNIAIPAPALGDWSGDGLADLAIGGETNVIQFVLSDGSWTGGSTQVIELAVASPSIVPAFGKIDNDNLVDLLVLTDSGLVELFPNTGISSLPYSANPSTTNLLGTAVPNATSITTADVNGDGILDILISDDNGSIWEFHEGENR